MPYIVLTPSGGNVGASDIVILVPTLTSEPTPTPVAIADQEIAPLIVGGSSGGGHPQLDAFGRWRGSEPFTLFNSRLTFDNAPLLWDDAATSGSGTTSTHSANAASVTLAVSASTAGTRVRQSKAWLTYQPGKSQLIMLTGVLGSGASGVTRRVGYFNAQNGLFFELAGSTLKIVVRSFTSGAAVDTGVAQSSWNLDKLDGTGASGVTLDVTKAQIFLIDFEWLGVGRIRFGFVIDGAILYCHQVLNANAATGVYMTTSNLPLRYEISNDGTGAAASLICLCNTVITEGGRQGVGEVRGSSNGNTHVDANTAGTLYACLGLRLKSTYLGVGVTLLTTSIMGSTANDNFQWQILLNPTVAGTFTFNDITNSALQEAKGATANTVTGGTVLASGYASSDTSIAAAFFESLLFQLGSLIDGTADRLVLAVMPVGSATNLDVYCSWTWREAT